MEKSIIITVVTPTLLRCAKQEGHSGECAYEHNAARPAFSGQCMKVRSLTGKSDILQAWRISQSAANRKLRVHVEQLAPVDSKTEEFYVTSVENALSTIAENLDVKFV